MAKLKKINSHGFTLVEVIISIGVLCLVCGIIVQLFITSGEVREKAFNQEMASLKAANVIEACKISDSPKNIGKGIFNDEATDYEIIENGVIIREFFSEGWNNPESGKTPVFVVRTILTVIDSIPDTQSEFGNTGNNNDYRYIVSRLYKITVTAGYVDTGREGEIILAGYNTQKHYVYREGQE